MKQLNNPPKRILIDANPLIGNKSGVGHFTLRLVEAIADNSEGYKVSAYYFNFLGLKNTDHLPLKEKVDYIEVRYLPSKLFSILHRLNLQLPIEFFLGLRRFDFIIFPNFVAVPSLRKIPYAVAVHDLGFMDCPQYLTKPLLKYLRRFVVRSINKSVFVISISEFTKSRIKHHFGKQASDKTVVVPIPYEKKFVRETIRPEIQKVTKKPYVLFVGNIEPRKNIANLIRGFDKLPDELKQKYQLVLAGGMGWKTEEIQDEINQKSSQFTINLTGYVNDNEREFLYKNSAAFAMVSHYEGFGMPVLEAQSYGKPILLSSIEVFHEVAGDHALYCDPNDPSDIGKKIATILTSGKPSKMKPTQSWAENAKQILDRVESSLKD